MARIGIDLDGVCYDFAASLREYCIQACLRFKHECPDATRWEFYEDWGFSLDEFLIACHRGVEAGVIFTHGDPYPNVREAFDRLRAAGHTIHIITDRSFGREGASEAATRGWLDRHGLRFDSLHFTADKTIVKVDAMVDDKLANYDALDAAGVNVWLHKRPWNKDGVSRRTVLDLLHFSEVVA